MWKSLRAFGPPMIMIMNWESFQIISAPTGGLNRLRWSSIQCFRLNALRGSAMVVAHSESLFDVVAPLGAGGGELVEDRLETLDLEADVVDAAETTAALDASRLIVLEIQDGQVDVAIAQEAPD